MNGYTRRTSPISNGGAYWVKRNDNILVWLDCKSVVPGGGGLTTLKFMIFKLASARRRIPYQRSL